MELIQRPKGGPRIHPSLTRADGTHQGIPILNSEDYMTTTLRSIYYGSQVLWQRPVIPVPWEAEVAHTYTMV